MSSGGLFVEEVEVTSSRGDRVLFPCRCWTVEEEDKVSVEDPLQTGTKRPPGKSVAVFVFVFVFVMAAC